MRLLFLLYEILGEIQLEKILTRVRNESFPLYIRDSIRDSAHGSVL